MEKWNVNFPNKYTYNIQSRWTNISLVPAQYFQFRYLNAWQAMAVRIHLMCIEAFLSMCKGEGGQVLVAASGGGNNHPVLVQLEAYTRFGQLPANQWVCWSCGSVAHKVQFPETEWHTAMCCSRGFQAPKRRSKLYDLRCMQPAFKFHLTHPAPGRYLNSNPGVCIVCKVIKSYASIPFEENTINVLWILSPMHELLMYQTKIFSTKNRILHVSIFFCLGHIWWIICSTEPWYPSNTKVKILT